MLTTLLITVTLLDTTCGGEPTEIVRRRLVEKWLVAMMSDTKDNVVPRIIPIANDSISKVFPTDQFYGVYWPRWPRVVMPPKHLPNELVLCVGQNESVEAIAGQDGIRGFLVRNVFGIRDEAHARTSVLAALWLLAFSAAGGPYDLQDINVSVVPRGKGFFAAAQAEVKPPARGNIAVDLQFQADGNVTDAGINIQGHPRGGPPS
jgi:hypothetical protein